MCADCRTPPDSHLRDEVAQRHAIRYSPLPHPPLWKAIGFQPILQVFSNRYTYIGILALFDEAENDNLGPHNVGICIENGQFQRLGAQQTDGADGKNSQSKGIQV